MKPFSPDASILIGVCCSPSKSIRNGPPLGAFRHRLHHDGRGSFRITAVQNGVERAGKRLGIMRDH